MNRRTRASYKSKPSSFYSKWNSVSETTYNIYSHSYITTDDISHDSNKEEPLIYKDSPHVL